MSLSSFAVTASTSSSSASSAHHVSTVARASLAIGLLVGCFGALLVAAAKCTVALSPNPSDRDTPFWICSVAPGTLTLSLAVALRQVVVSTLKHAGHTSDSLVVLVEHRYILGLLLAVLANWVICHLLMGTSLWQEQPSMGLYALFVLWYAQTKKVSDVSRETNDNSNNKLLEPLLV